MTDIVDELRNASKPMLIPSGGHMTIVSSASVFDRAAAEIERLEGVIRVLRDTKGWHIEAGGGKDLLVCCGDHEKGAPCDFHRYRHVDEQSAESSVMRQARLAAEEVATWSPERKAHAERIVNQGAYGQSPK